MEFDIDLNDVATFGVVKDIPGYQLPPEAWTTGHNIRYVDGVPTRVSGQAQVFGTPGVTPHFLLPISGPTQVWWLYTSLTKAYVYDTVSHVDITRAIGGDYTGTKTRQWNGTILGGIPILNNGVDVPQTWNTYSTGTKLVPLVNWPAGYTAKVIRAFGSQLVAFNITKAGSVYPHNVLFSHTADPGTLPTSWDITDATKDTGENSLPDVDSGTIVDAMMLSGNMYIGKENAIWRMRQIGGRFLFSFDTYLETAGLLSARCMVNVGILRQQVIWTQDDIIIHNGTTQTSLLSKKWRRYLFNAIDTTNYQNCFIFDNAASQEVWFCFPSSGKTECDTALVWNYSNGSSVFSTVDINFRNVAAGVLATSDTLDWEANTDTWEADDVQWDTNDRRRVVACCTDLTQFQTLDRGVDRNGTSYTATLQRTGLSLIGRKRTGEWIVDFKTVKMYKRVWLKLQGSPVNIRVGVQMMPEGVVTWGVSQLFDPSVSNYIDTILTGRALSIEISSTTSASWALQGYRVEFNAQGHF